MASNRVEPQADPPQNGSMEPRLARVEAHVEHLIVSMQAIRTDVRELRKSSEQQFIELRKSIDERFYVLLGATTGLAGLIAKGFHWF